jgi:hypothetical protein
VNRRPLRSFAFCVRAYSMFIAQPSGVEDLQ